MAARTLNHNFINHTSPYFLHILCILINLWHTNLYFFLITLFKYAASDRHWYNLISLNNNKLVHVSCDNLQAEKKAIVLVMHILLQYIRTIHAYFYYFIIVPTLITQVTSWNYYIIVTLITNYIWYKLQ